MTDYRLDIIRIVLASLASLCVWGVGAATLAWVPFVLPVALMFSPLRVTCTRCDGNAGPIAFQLDIGGFTDAACSTCETYNGSFVCSFVTESGIGGCLYQAPTITSGFCQTCDTVAVHLTGGGPISIDAGISGGLGSCGTGGTMISWLETGVTPDPDCMAFSSRVIPFSGLAAGATCNHDGSDALLTTL